MTARKALKDAGDLHYRVEKIAHGLLLSFGMVFPGSATTERQAAVNVLVSAACNTSAPRLFLEDAPRHVGRSGARVGARLFRCDPAPNAIDVEKNPPTYFSVRQAVWLVLPYPKGALVHAKLLRELLSCQISIKQGHLCISVLIGDANKMIENERSIQMH